MSFEEFQKEFQPCFKTGPREKDVVHHVVEASPKLRDIMLKKGRIHLQFMAIFVNDYLVSPNSMKCQDLGHIAKYCQNEESCSAHCGNKGHDKKSCDRKEQNQVCVACKRRGKSVIKWVQKVKNAKPIKF